MNDIQVLPAGSMVSQQTVGAELFERFVNYLDTSPKTVETYTKALRQLFNYFSFRGIKQPQREDLKASWHKPTTVQNYITAAKLFFKEV